MTHEFVITSVNNIYGVEIFDKLTFFNDKILPLKINLSIYLSKLLFTKYKI